MIKTYCYCIVQRWACTGTTCEVELVHIFSYSNILICLHMLRRLYFFSSYMRFCVIYANTSPYLMTSTERDFGGINSPHSSWFCIWISGKTTVRSDCPLKYFFLQKKTRKSWPSIMFLFYAQFPCQELVFLCTWPSTLQNPRSKTVCSSWRQRLNFFSLTKSPLPLFLMIFSISFILCF